MKPKMLFMALCLMIGCGQIDFGHLALKINFQKIPIATQNDLVLSWIDVEVSGPTTLRRIASYQQGSMSISEVLPGEYLIEVVARLENGTGVFSAAATSTVFAGVETIVQLDMNSIDQ